MTERLLTRSAAFINKRGNTANLYKVTRTGFNSVTQQYTSISNGTAIPTKAVEFPYEAKEIDGENVLVQDKRFYVSSLNLTVDLVIGDLFETVGVKFQIINVKKHTYRDTLLFFELQVRI